MVVYGNVINIIEFCHRFMKKSPFAQLTRVVD